MKKFIVFVLFTALVLSAALSTGVYEKAYDDFWKILEDYYPQYVVAEKGGLDLKSLKVGGKEQVKSIKSDEELVLVLRNIANRFLPYDYIDISMMGKIEGGGENAGVSLGVPSYRYIPSLKTVVFSVSLLSFDEGYLAEVVSSLGDVEHIVFDLTTCSSFSNDLDPILSPFGGTWTYSYEGYLRSKDIVKDYPELTIAETEKGMLPYEYGLPYTAHRTVDYDYGEGTIKGKAKDAKRWLLTGNMTGFGADFLVSFAKETGWATVVGTPANGNGTGLMPASFILPGTNVVVSFNPMVMDDGKGELMTRSGNVPDVLAPVGKTALSVCLSIIENN